MDFERYKDLSGDGGIIAYLILESAIIILFNNGYMYLYNYRKPGKEHIDQMKKFAKAGKGLKTYINQKVRDNYSDKFKKLPPLLAA